ncbi:MAG TPA: hypothetical protein VJL59_03720 [Anaerolineales bacterium]|nr:hypothetical protein [Anaerolineales bacterium]
MQLIRKHSWLVLFLLGPAFVGAFSVASWLMYGGTTRAPGLRQEGSSFAYDKFFLPAGEHTIRLSLDDSGGDLKTVIEQTVDFAPGQIRTLTFDRVEDKFELK